MEINRQECILFYWFGKGRTLCYVTFVLKLGRKQAVDIHWGRRKSSKHKSVLDMSEEEQGGQCGFIIVGHGCIVEKEIVDKSNDQITQHTMGLASGSLFLLTHEKPVESRKRGVHDIIWSYFFL